jgi:F-box-like
MPQAHNTAQLPKRRSYPMETLPNAQQIAAAKADLAADSEALGNIQRLEDATLTELREVQKQYYKRIGHLHVERDIIKANESAALSFIAPIRRLPLEIYRAIFLIASSMDNLGHTSWHISGVCRLWRRMALNIPHLWSHIRFHGTLATSPDIIRLWVERSGPSVSLDIDIEILRRKRVPLSGLAARQSSQHRRLVQGLMRLRSNPMPQTNMLEDSMTRNATQWGHVALFYLTAQKHRWRTFVFESMEVPIEALQVLNGLSLSPLSCQPPPD